MGGHSRPCGACPDWVVLRRGVHRCSISNLRGRAGCGGGRGSGRCGVEGQWQGHHGSRWGRGGALGHGVLRDSTHTDPKHTTNTPRNSKTVFFDSYGSLLSWAGAQLVPTLGPSTCVLIPFGVRTPARQPLLTRAAAAREQASLANLLFCVGIRVGSLRYIPLEPICIHSLSACTFPVLAIIYLKHYLYSCMARKAADPVSKE